MPNTIRLFVLGLMAAFALALYLDWSARRPPVVLLSDLRPATVVSHGEPSTRGNLLGIETALAPADYQAPERLSRKFAHYLEQARDAGLLNSATVVVLPEHVGTGLFAVGEKPEVLHARTLRDAMQWTALSNPWGYLHALWRNQARDDRRTEAVLRIKAPEMAAYYQHVFGELAARFGVTLVAGSIVLPEPRLEAGRLRIGKGPLQQVSLVFDPRGEVLEPIWYKDRLSRYEGRYSAPGPLPPGTTPTAAGRLAVRLGCSGAPALTAETPDLLAIPGAPAATEPCPVTLPAGSRMEVRTLGLPWNLLGSPRRPSRNDPRQPARLVNHWLAAP
ncbi:carbon-nitrogen hydrolase [Stutzerimonas azotifigens]|uniref:carbon-nitrogen hydrolase n=1 Tax=Stutzerimonas azotifigens TaxID=291995 RepID=UPI0004838149|nr:carbon-nitrogen hydrolase [Stutzerimonas azotifigens]